MRIINQPAIIGGFAVGAGVVAVRRAISRYITRLSAAADMYYKLSEPVLIGAGEDFEIELNIAWDGAAYGRLLSGGGSVSKATNINIEADGRVGVGVNGESYNISSATVEQGEATNLLIVRDGSTGAVTITSSNGTSGLLSGKSGLSVFELIGTNASGIGSQGFITGEIYDLKIWTGGDRNTGTLVVDMPIDEDWTCGTVVHNRAADLGVELVVNGTFESGTDAWSPNNSTLTVDENGRLIVTGTVASSNAAIQGISTTVGATYLLEFDFIKGTAPNVQQVRIGSTPQGLNVLQKTIPLSKTYTFLFTAISTTTYLNFGYGETEAGQTSIWDNISVREIPAGYPFATAVNVTENEAEKFTKVDNGANWLGEEIVNPALMVAINTGTSTSTFVNGVGHIQTSGDYTAIRQSDSLIVGAKYKARFNVTDYVEGLGIIIGETAGSGRSVFTNSNGSYITTFNADSTPLQFKRWSNATDMKLSDLSTKRIIPIAQGGA